MAQVMREKPAALTRRNGPVFVESGVSEAVGRCAFLEINAKRQTQAIALAGDEVHYLSVGEAFSADAPTRGDGQSCVVWPSKALSQPSEKAAQKNPKHVYAQPKDERPPPRLGRIQQFPQHPLLIGNVVAADVRLTQCLSRTSRALTGRCRARRDLGVARNF